LNTFSRRKQINPYLVRLAVLKSGERLPMLCRRSTGMPLFEPTVFAITELRAQNRASATIQQALRAVMVLYRVFDRLKIDLDERLGEARLLELGEIEELVRWCRLPLEAFTEQQERPEPPARIVSLEKVRMKSVASGPAEIDPNTVAVRIHYIRHYLKWLADGHMLKSGRNRADPTLSNLRINSEIVLRSLDERIPPSLGRSDVGQRQGMSETELATLIDVIQPGSPENPWKGQHAKERNALIVRWLLGLGIRRGELLGVRVPDVDFQANEVLIARRADDLDDPRANEPNTKTRDRLLSLEEDLAVLTRRYVTGVRRHIAGARKHDYLFVANGTGVPLSLSGLNKIFVVLRTKCPNLPDDLSAHVFRHTWNDEFSDLMDERQVSEETEKKMRSRLMGWSPTSGTAAVYTRRHTKKKADEASLALQSKLKPRREE
jgi:integrase